MPIQGAGWKSGDKEVAGGKVKDAPKEKPAEQPEPEAVVDEPEETQDEQEDPSQGEGEQV